VYKKLKMDGKNRGKNYIAVLNFGGKKAEMREG
jgi:hypothetical protein